MLLSISATGTGRSVYYSQSDLVELAVMEYWLSVGLSFEVARENLEKLREREPQFVDPHVEKRWMLAWNAKARSLELVEFDLEEAIASFGFT
jgi:DNA-binding transcriptional MerR regulator